MSGQDSNAPSMIGGHAQYVKGYVAETVGKALGSKDWEESGKQQTSEAISEMKAANEARQGEPAASGIGGKVEHLAGRATGCEGMEKEGLERQEKAEKGQTEGVESRDEGLLQRGESAK